MSAPIENASPQSGESQFVPVLAEVQIRAKPIKSLDTPEPIPDTKGSLSSDQLREIAKRRQPPVAWFEGEEEQLF